MTTSTNEPIEPSSMTNDLISAQRNDNMKPWPWWKSIAFRFAFIYLLLQMAPWLWLDDVPGISYITRWYYNLADFLVTASNKYIFHIRPVLVPLNGSGDTSFGWAQVYLFLSLSLAGCLLWSVLDSKRPGYIRLNYWLCLFARYYIALFAFIYGILKLFALQMPFPSIHQLATPLGDLLPMRLSWMFIGYSRPYQVFSGAMETLAGLLLLNRRTATLGVIMATAVFTNVMMLNLCYDIPVKIFSIHLVLICLYLLANEATRVFYFFVLNKPAPQSVIYHLSYSHKWMKAVRIGLKVLFIGIAVFFQVYSNARYYQSMQQPPATPPIKNGVYEVAVYKVNNSAVPLSISDTLRWQDVIFDNNTGSIKTADTAFRQTYRRGYFVYKADSTRKTLSLKKFETDSLPFAILTYQINGDKINLRGKLHNDSLYIELKRLNRHYQLAGKQFHWLSEYNR